MRWLLTLLLCRIVHSHPWRWMKLASLKRGVRGEYVIGICQHCGFWRRYYYVPYATEGATAVKVDEGKLPRAWTIMKERR